MSGEGRSRLVRDTLRADTCKRQGCTSCDGRRDSVESDDKEGVAVVSEKGVTRSAAEALSRCREAVRRIEDGISENERDEGMWCLYVAFTRLDTYLTGGASLPEPWRVAGRLDAFRAPDAPIPQATP